MKHTGKCPKCDSTHIIADAKAVDRGHSNLQHEMAIATFRDPDAFLFKGKTITTVSAWVCVDCGFIEYFADCPQNLDEPAT